MSIFGNLFSPNRPSLDSVTFDASGYTNHGKKNGAYIWFLPGGGGVGLYFSPQPPNLPEALSSVDQLRDFYAAQMGLKQRVVEFRIQPLDGVRGIWLITAEPSPACRGVVYMVSLTIPFKDFSFVVKIQCQEQGITGIREALVLDLALKDGSAIVQDGKIIGQSYLPEDEQFDSRLPQHPLSRVRRELRHIAASLRLEEHVRKEKPFDLPRDVA